MIKIPIEEIYAKIREKTSLSDQQIEEKIEQKLSQLSGLISKEGAAHIIANELGVKLFDAVSGRLQIKNILPGMRSVETVGRVRQVYEIREFQTEQRSGKVGSFILADETGFIRVVCWGNLADNIKKMRLDDAVKIKGGYVRNNNGRKEVHLNEKSVVLINPIDESVAQLKQMTPKRSQIKDLKEGENNTEVLATIVQVQDPAFFESCPSCRRKVTLNNGESICTNHGVVNPRTSLVMNVVLDDGTDDMRVVFFGDQSSSLTKKSYSELVLIKENPSIMEEVKAGLLGKIVKVEGRMVKNKMFDRLEMIANTIDLNPNPDDELKRLQEEVEKVKKES